MARMIDADRLKQYFDIVGVNEYGCSFATIDSQPTVDAEPVRRGKWIARKRNENEPTESIDYCSCCMYPISHFWQGDYKYCPNCGAKMQEE